MDPDEFLWHRYHHYRRRRRLQHLVGWVLVGLVLWVLIALLVTRLA